MNRPIPRAEIEKFTAGLAEKRRRLAKAEQSTRGYRDEEGVWRGGLLSFVRYFWHVLEPGTKFTEGWILEAIVQHLEAVTFGEVTNLLINVPPGCCKSLLTNVFFPAWEHGPMEMPHIRYVTFSYASTNTERDNQRFADLITSSEYQAMYPHVKVRQTGTTKVSNYSHGWKLASSVGGVGTGQRGNRAICFPADQVVQTEQGPLAIGKIVEERLALRVWSYNRANGTMELKKIDAWHKNPGRQLVKITLEDGRSVTCTEDHPILSDDGYRRASTLRIGQLLCCAQFGPGGQSEMSPSASISNVIDRATSYAKLFGKKVGGIVGASRDASDILFRKLRESMGVLWAFGTSPAIIGLQSEIEMAPYSAISNAGNRCWANPVLNSQLSCEPLGLRDNFSHHFFSKVTRAVSEGAVSLAIVDILKPCTILKIIKSWIASVSVFVSHLLLFGARTDKCCGHQDVHHFVEGLSVSPQGNPWVSLYEGPRHDLAGNDHFVRGLGVASSVSVSDEFAFSNGRPRQTLNLAQVGDLVVLKANYGSPYLARIISVEYLHDIPVVTYCLTVRDNHNMAVANDVVRGGVICSNCDDLNNVKESESKTVMEETNRWFRESLSSRLNNMETDAKIVIAQRVSEGDVSGEILRLGLPYCHLLVQMEFEWQADEDGNPYTTSIGWVDPRWRPNPEDCEGELAWPERFSEKAVQSLKVELGPFATASQLQQTPEARGGGILKREFWQPAEQYMTGNRFPAFEYVIASLDGAFDEKEENDPSALTIWGIFQNEHGYNRAMLIHAWAKKLQISGPKIEIMPGEHEMVYRRRAMPHWGLVEWTADTCNRFKVDRLLIENKASGKPAAQSLQNSHGRAGWRIQLVEPKGDKYARGLAVQPSFSQDMIYAPDREWAQDVIDQCAIFPKGRHDDLYDSTTQAIKHLRDSGLIRSDEDRRAEEVEALRHKGAPKAPAYPGFRRRQA